jgi:hypothetical protein
MHNTLAVQQADCDGNEENDHCCDEEDSDIGTPGACLQTPP